MEVLIILLMILGTVLCVCEMAAPGFGIFGISGLIILAISTFLSYSYFGFSLYLTILIQSIFVCIIGFITYYLAKKSNTFNKLILKETVNQEQNKLNDDLVGKIGVCKTPLKPVGTIIIDDEAHQALSSGEYIDIGQKIIVKKISNKNIIVARYNEEN